MTPSTLRDVPLWRAADNLADRLSDIEDDIRNLLHRTGLAESLLIDEIVADVSACDERTANVDVRWSKLTVPGYGPSRLVVARQLRAFADGLEGLDCDL